MNPPLGYEYPEVGEVISKEFLVEEKGKWQPVSISIGLKIDASDFGGWARPKNKHWNSHYSSVKRPNEFRFLEEGEVIRKGDYCIDGAGFRVLPSVAMVIGTKNSWTYSAILRPINKIAKPKKKTALQLANEKVAALTKKLEDLKAKVKNFAAEL